MKRRACFKHGQRLVFCGQVPQRFALTLYMSSIFWLGAITLAAFIVWIFTEVRTANRWNRIGSGSLAAVCLAFWLLGLANSINDYYDGMREHRLAQSLIRECPSKTAQLQKWSLAYARYDGRNHESRMNELEKIMEERR